MREKIILLFSSVILFCFSCNQPDKKHYKVTTVSQPQNVRDLPDILESGHITAIVDNSSTGMFLYRGEPLGFEYELLSTYARNLGVELQFKITPSIEEGFKMIRNGEGDILAHNLTITKERKKKIDFTEAHYYTRQVLIQRKPKNWRQMKLHEIEKSLIRNVIDLIGEEVHVRKHSSYGARLKNLSEEIGGEIKVVEDFEDIETESVIELVASGEIEYTVADENLAYVISKQYPNLDIRTPVSFPQQIAWGLPHGTDSLKHSINQWFNRIKKTSKYNELYNKYFKNSSKTKRLLKSDFYSKTGEHISPYDSLIKKYATEVGWHWKLLAAQISKESRFDPHAESWVGAVGLMQIMPKTADSYHVSDLEDPQDNIRAGVQHLKWLQKKWVSIPDSIERQKFILASYNVGDGHVRDATKLAKKYGANPQKWEGHVAQYLKLKSHRKYYEDAVVKYGYCRGNEPVQYVEDIFYRYNRYIQLEGI